MAHKLTKINDGPTFLFVDIFGDECAWGESVIVCFSMTVWIELNKDKQPKLVNVLTEEIDNNLWCLGIIELSGSKMSSGSAISCI